MYYDSVPISFHKNQRLHSPHTPCSLSALVLNFPYGTCVRFLFGFCLLTWFIQTHSQSFSTRQITVCIFQLNFITVFEFRRAKGTKITIFLRPLIYNTPHFAKILHFSTKKAVKKPLIFHITFQFPTLRTANHFYIYNFARYYFRTSFTGGHDCAVQDAGQRPR